MHIYRLKFDDDATRCRRDIEFEAEDALQALVIAHKEASHSSAELWRDGHKVCKITRVVADVWQIDPLANLAAADARS
jgi:hypothetical protein